MLLIAVCSPSQQSEAQDNAGTAESEPLENSWSAWKFRDVDVTTLTRRLSSMGIPIPVTLTGMISGGVNVDVPWTSLRDARAWRLGGMLTSPKLKIDDLTVESLAVVIEYRNGNLHLDQLRFRVPDDENHPEASEPAAVGLVTGQAQMELVPRGKFTATLTVDALPLAAISEFIDERPPVSGLLSGSLTAEADVDRLRDLTAWAIAGPVSLQRFTLSESPPAEADVELQLSNGIVTARDFNLQVGKTKVTGEARLHLLGQRNWNAEGTVDAQDLAALLQLLDRFLEGANLQQVADALDGSMRASAKLSGTLSPVSRQASGQIVLTNLRVRLPEQLVKPFSLKPVDVEGLELDYDLRQDELTLSNIIANVAGGRVTGEAGVSLGTAELQADLAWTELRPNGLLGEPFGGDGTSTGRIRLTLPLHHATEPDRWSIVSNVTISELSYEGWSFANVRTGEMHLEKAMLRIPQLTARLDEQPVSLDLTMGVQPPWPVDAQFHLQHVPLSQLGSIPQLSKLKDRLSGRGTLTGQARGQLDPLTLMGKGSAEIDALTFDENRVDSIRFDYELAEQSLQISSIDASAYGGSLTGTADVPLTPQTPGKVDVQWKNVEFGQILDQIFDLPIALQGRSIGRLEVSAPGGQHERPETWNITAAAEIPKLSLQNIALASVQAEVRQREGQLEYQASGSVLGGSFQLTGSRDAVQAGDRFSELGSGNLTLQGANVAPVVTIWLPALKERMRATADVTGSWESTADGLAWNAAAELNEVGIRDRVVAQGLSLRLQGLNQRIRLDDLTGRVAGGRLVATAEGDLSQTQPIDFRIDLRRASLQTLSEFAPLEPNVALDGPLDVSLHGQTGRTWRMRGTAASVNGRLSGVQLRDIRIPFRFDWHPESGHMALQLTKGHVSLPSGRVTGTLKVRRSGGLMIDGDYRMHNVRLQAILQQLGSRSQFAKGRLSGSFRISGRNVRSINDVQATLLADLKDAQPMNMPVLSQIRSFVPGAAATGATRFREGRLEARLRRGVIEVSRLSLASSQLQIYIRGRVNVDGTIDLDAVVSSGRGNDPVLAELLLSRLVAAVSPPAGAVLLANDYLANRVVHLGIRGTIRQPVIRVKPFESLGEEAVRFFLRQSTGGIAQ